MDLIGCVDSVEIENEVKQLVDSHFEEFWASIPQAHVDKVALRKSWLHKHYFSLVALALSNHDKPVRQSLNCARIQETK